MDRIRKTLEWLWRNKERMVLGVVVAVLCSRVYEVLNPEPPPPPPVISFPKPQIPDDSAELEGLGLPEKPPPPPPPLIPEVWRPLWQRNPFWYNATIGEADKGEDVEDGDPGISVLRIMSLADGRVRAQLQTRSSKKWYDEGEPFEKYELISIDAENEQCEVYSEEHGRSFTIKIGKQ